MGFSHSVLFSTRNAKVVPVYVPPLRTTIEREISETDVSREWHWLIFPPSLVHELCAQGHRNQRDSVGPFGF